MGADIYLNSVYQANHAIYYPQFNDWIARRDELKDEIAIKKAQEQVDFFYNKMYEKGYFRDSYNATSLFWLLDLSWWQADVEYGYFQAEAPFAPIAEPDGDTDDYIYGWDKDACQKMLDVINQKMQDGTFQARFDASFGAANIRNNSSIYQDMDLSPAEDSAGWLKMFMGKYEQITTLLRLAIELEEPLSCSV